MDGNQRWALINKKNKLEGYLAGLNNLKLIIDKCIEKKIKNLTVYALSSENINRASSKIIFNLIRDKHKEFLKELLKNYIINIIFCFFSRVKNTVCFFFRIAVCWL